MFGFANALLLALVLAAGVDAALALRAAAPGRGRCRRALAGLWHTPHLLFGPWGTAARLRAGEVLFTVGLCCYEVSVAFCNSMARDAWPWVQGVLAPALDWAAFLCWGAKILLGTRYTWRELTVAGALYFIARWVHFNSHNIFWIGLVVAVLAAKDLDLRRALDAFLSVGAATVVLVMLLNAGNLLPPAPDLAGERNVTEIRLTLGYGHPNTFGGLAFGLGLGYAMRRAARPRWGDAAVLAVLGVLIWAGPASRTAALACLALAAGLAFCRLRAGAAIPRAAARVYAAAVPALAAVSFLLPLGMYKNGPGWSDFGPAWLSALDNLLTGRLSMVWLAYRLLPVKIAGQMLPDWPALDCSFVYALYQFGPVVAVLLAALLIAALWGYARRGDRVLVFCLLAMLVYAFMESQSFHLTTNPAALLLAGAVFGQKPERWLGGKRQAESI